MKQFFQKWIGNVFMVTMICMAGMFITGPAFSASGQECVDNNDGTVTDNKTGLMWQKTSTGPMPWHVGKSYAAGLSLGGHSGWRLPTTDELMVLFNSPCKCMMDAVEGFCWTSLPYTYRPNFALGVDFSNGNVDYYYIYYFNGKGGRVRAVR
jgi:hypothetical protein